MVFRIMGVVFGFVFFGVAALIGVLLFRTLWDAKAMQRWDEVPAHIEECHLETHKGWGRHRGVTHTMTALYRYTVKGQDYTGQRIVMDMAHDNSQYPRIYQQLSVAKEAGETVLCRVNPRDPSEAVLLWMPDPKSMAGGQAALLLLGWFGFYFSIHVYDYAVYFHSKKGRRIPIPSRRSPPRAFAVMATLCGLCVIVLTGFVVSMVGFVTYPWWGYALLIPATAMPFRCFLLDDEATAH